MGSISGRACVIGSRILTKAVGLEFPNVPRHLNAEKFGSMIQSAIRETGFITCEYDIIRKDCEDCHR